MAFLLLLCIFLPLGWNRKTQKSGFQAGEEEGGGSGVRGSSATTQFVLINISVS